MNSPILQVKSVSISLGPKKIINDISFDVYSKDIIVVKGSNGVGKTTLFRAITGDKKFKINGNILFGGRNISSMDAHERAKAGIFLVFQEPPTIPGISFNTLFKETLSAVEKDRIKKMKNDVKDKSKNEDENDIKLRIMNMNKDKLNRNLNDGFSGGEKKKMELLQLVLAEPKIALIDEVDSGMDAEGIKLIVEVINYLHSKGTAILIITHQYHWTSLLSGTKTISLD